MLLVISLHCLIYTQVHTHTQVCMLEEHCIEVCVHKTWLTTKLL